MGVVGWGETRSVAAATHASSSFASASTSAPAHPTTRAPASRAAGACPSLNSESTRSVNTLYELLFFRFARILITDFDL